MSEEIEGDGCLAAGWFGFLQMQILITKPTLIESVAFYPSTITYIDTHKGIRSLLGHLIFLVINHLIPCTWLAKCVAVSFFTQMLNQWIFGS